jgi:hypothetical protein
VYLPCHVVFVRVKWFHYILDAFIDNLFSLWLSLDFSDAAFRLSLLRHGVDSTSSLRIISRRGMSCSTAQVNLFEKAYEAKYSPVLAPK